MSNCFLYEYPLNERNRTFMRLEYFFNQVEHFSSINGELEIMAAVQGLIEIINILERNDVRSEILKELDRQHVSLKKLFSTPDIDREKLTDTLGKIETYNKILQTTAGKQTRQIRHDEFINSIRQRLALSSSLCSFDIPSLHHWLHQPFCMRQKQFNQWLSEFVSIEDSIIFVLNLIRNSALFETKVANSGFFQKQLDHNSACQIIRIALPDEMQVFPEISGSKHRVNVRFLNYAHTAKRPEQTNKNVEFDISCCYL